MGADTVAGDDGGGAGECVDDVGAGDGVAGADEVTGAWPLAWASAAIGSSERAGERPACDGGAAGVMSETRKYPAMASAVPVAATAAKVSFRFARQIRLPMGDAAHPRATSLRPASLESPSAAEPPGPACTMSVMARTDADTMSRTVVPLGV